jgi:hypothetical protein
MPASLPELWRELSPEERLLAAALNESRSLSLLLRLLQLRALVRPYGFANRCIPGPTHARLLFARYLVQSGRLHEAEEGGIRGVAARSREQPV